MKKMWLVVLFVVLTIGFFLPKPKPEPARMRANQPLLLSPTQTPSLPFQQSLFVPYWTLSTIPASSYTTLIYFGIVPTLSGIDTSEKGYASLPTFVSKVSPHAKKIIGD